MLSGLCSVLHFRMISSFWNVFFPMAPSFSSSFPGFSHQANIISQPPPCQNFHHYVSITSSPSSLSSSLPLLVVHMLNSSESCSYDLLSVFDSFLLSLFISLGSYCSSSSLVKLYLAHLRSIRWSNKSLILFRQCLGGGQLLISL